ncbi:MAG: metallophosphoesterase [Clostridia bacterium]|nr:metallophosphoesterase [Clostridia bacterium]
MRIIFVGDLQYATAEEENLGFKMEQLRSLKPDLAVVMGDIGGSHMGSFEGFDETKRYVDMLGCPYEVILGNHDVEYSPYEPDVFDFEKTFHEVFTGHDLFTVKAADGVLYICVSCEHRPPEDFRTHNAVFVSDGQFAKIIEALERHPDMPAVLVTHAPLAGSGVRRWLPLHCAATDYYMDQTFNTERWLRLLKDYPQIRMSVSAHLHMSHEYDSAITFREGIVHVSCGAMTICARDDIQQTRVMDADRGRAVIYTFDHASGVFRKDAEYSFAPGSVPLGRVAFPEKDEMPIGFDEIYAVYRLEEKGRYFFATKNGLLWDYEPALREFTGALLLRGGAQAMSFDGSRLYIKKFSGEIYSLDPDSSGRYDRKGAHMPQEIVPETEMRGSPLPTAEYAVRKAKDGTHVRITEI